MYFFIIIFLFYFGRVCVCVYALILRINSVCIERAWRATNEPAQTVCHKAGNMDRST